MDWKEEQARLDRLTEVIARTDPNYQDDEYIEVILDIANLAWGKAAE